MILRGGADLSLNGRIMQIGDNAGNSGTIIVCGGGSNINACCSNGTLDVGDEGNGWLYLNGGADLNIKQADLDLGRANGAQGTLFISGNGIIDMDCNATNDLFIGTGNCSLGYFDSCNGNILVGGNIIVTAGVSGIGTVNLHNTTCVTGIKFPCQS